MNKGIIFFLVIIFSEKIIADVSPLNGNFHITYKDVLINESFPLQRTYNSKAIEIGLFGFGWGSELDTKLIIGPSGAPVIYHNGSGSISYFKPIEMNNSYTSIESQSIELMVKNILMEKVSKEHIQLKKEAKIKLEKEIRDKLHDEQYRTSEWNRLTLAGKVPVLNAQSIPNGTEFSYTCKCSFSLRTLIKTSSGFELSYQGLVWSFDLQGAPLSIQSSKKPKMIFERDSEGKINKILYGNEIIKIQYDNNGYVAELKDVRSSKAAFFTYKNRNLISATNANDYRYIYEYDKNHNMTKIIYADNTNAKIDYDKNSMVTGLTDQLGNQTKYEFGVLKGDPNLNYYTSIIYRPHNGGYKHERKEYHLRQTEEGATINSEISSEANGIIRTYNYDNEGVLSQIKTSSTPAGSGGETLLNYKFDSFGRVENVKSKQWNKAFEYVDGNETKRIKIISQQGVRKNVRKFEYNSKGWLTKATNENDEVSIIYQKNKDKIESFKSRDQEVKLVRDNGKLIKIELIEAGRFYGAIVIDGFENGKPGISSTNQTSSKKIAAVLAGMIAICEKSKAEIRI